uniref:Plastid division protein PDV1 n=1 Tax=Leersia perrieri TaxID=77586 RepID=A0A0D9VEH8_9ORYZ
MRWDAAEAEAVLERIWDLHDRLSDAILAVSRAHFLLPPPPPPPPPSAPPAGDAAGRRNGYVFVKGVVKGGGGGGDGVDGGGGRAASAAEEAVAEARSLHAIRTALEDLEDHLEFLHLIPAIVKTVQSQQRAEQDAAIARLEQSRLVLAMRLAEHHGKKYRVIDEALAFVGEVGDKSRFISPEDVRATHNQSGEDAMDNGSNGSSIMGNVLSCSLSLAKNSFRVDKIGSALGNAAAFAVSMLAFLQLHQVAFGSRSPTMDYRRNSFHSGSSLQNGKGKQLEVYLARG